ncbi:MAG: 2-oxoacid:acceptor oxidoreductase family protein, partial [Methanotrichaceae archaeon]
MDNFSTLIGGIAGDGINEAGVTVGRIFNRLGYRIYMYYDYPSLIRGGHNFSIVRASSRKIGAHMDKVDVLIALNQETVEGHKDRLNENSFVIYDSDKVKFEDQKQKGCGLPISKILKEEGAPQLMKNTCILGGFCKVVGIDWIVLEEVLK